MRYYLFTIVYVFIFGSALRAQVSDPIIIRGTIFNDKNKNGIQDRSERGIRHVPVSNGREIVYTDRKGQYSISALPGQSVFPISPKGYGLLRDTNHSVLNAAFSYLDPLLTYSEDSIINFALHAQAQSTNFRVGAIGDVQTGNLEELRYAGRSIFNELLQRPDIDFTIFLGDIFNDDLSLIPMMSELFKTLPSPVWALPGNHDRNTDHPAYMNDIFNRHFGAGTFAFNYSNVHFLVFDNIFATGKNSYEGRYTDDQLSFLKNDLEKIPHDQLVVISQHIPMMYTHNKKVVFDILKPFSKVLILSGHTHRVGRHFYEGGRIQELVAGSAAGMWWTGEKDAFGVPEALMQCGSPRNYFTIDFRQNDYDIQFKAIELPDYYQMDISVDSNKVIANIFGGSDSTEVWMQVDKQEWIKMEQQQLISQRVLDIITKNKSKIYPSAGSRANPLRKQPSPHIWTAPYIHRKEEKIQTIRIRARDKYGFNVEAETYYF